MAYRYYEERLPPRERDAYRAIMRGLSSYENRFSAPRLDTDRLGDIFSVVKLDNPLIFGVEKLSFTYYDGSSSVTIKPEYTMKKQEYLNTLETVKKRVKKVLSPAEGKSVVEKETFIHDYIVKNVRYDRLTKGYSHEVTGPLCHGIGVCEGMAKTFKLLCDEAGIDSLVCSGIGVPPDTATGKKSERHAWNVVFLDGKSFGVDVTFDATLSGETVRYDYFNISDRIMSRDHGSLDFPVPVCVSDEKDPYRSAGLLFEDADCIAPALDIAAKSPYSVAFRMKMIPSSEEFGEKIMEIMKSNSRYRRFGSFSYSLNQISGVAEVTLRPASDGGK